MRIFKDAQGRDWTLAVNVTAVKRVRSLVEIDLLEIFSDKTLLGRLYTDPVLLCDVLYALCKPEADGKQISDEDFGRAMAGEAIERATEAFLGELSDFFPRGRAATKKALQKMQQFAAEVDREAERRIDSPAIDSQLRRILSGSGSPSVPGSSGSPPETTPSPS